jgi:hypothetical protein
MPRYQPKKIPSSSPLISLRRIERKIRNQRSEAKKPRSQIKAVHKQFKKLRRARDCLITLPLTPPIEGGERVRNDGG